MRRMGTIKAKSLQLIAKVKCLVRKSIKHLPKPIRSRVIKSLRSKMFSV